MFPRFTTPRTQPLGAQAGMPVLLEGTAPRTQAGSATCRARMRRQYSVAIEHVFAGFGYRTASLRPAPLTFHLQAQLQTKIQKRRPEASGTKDGAIAVVDA